jgi:chromosome segregation ATPase
MDLVLALAGVFFLGTTCFLLMGRADRARAVLDLDQSLTGARRDLATATRKLEEGQARHHKTTSELSQLQREHKEHKQKLHAAREKANKGRSSRESHVAVEGELVVVRSRVAELEAQVADQSKRLRSQRTELDTLKNAKPEGAAEVVSRAAAEQGGVSEEALQRALAEARREVASEVRVQLREDHGEQIGVLKRAVHTERRDRAAAAVEARRNLRRYQDSQRAYAITQGQLEMAHDRIFFLETGTHRRPHRPESTSLAESAVNAGSSAEYLEHLGEQEPELEHEPMEDTGSSAQFLESLVDGEPEQDEVANA